MGAVVTSSDSLKERLAFLQNCKSNLYSSTIIVSLFFSVFYIIFMFFNYKTALGAVPSPFDCYLVLRSIRTLHVRMPLHMKNAYTIAKFLVAHPKIEKVLHPGLPDHPQHQLALKQTSGHSGLISFYIKDGNSSTFLKNLKVFSLAESLGGYESLAELP